MEYIILKCSSSPNMLGFGKLNDFGDTERPVFPCASCRIDMFVHPHRFFVCLFDLWLEGVDTFLSHKLIEIRGLTWNGLEEVTVTQLPFTFRCPSDTWNLATIAILAFSFSEIKFGAPVFKRMRRRCVNAVEARMKSSWSQQVERVSFEIL